MIQVVFVKWGTAYDHRHINGMIDEIRKHTTAPLRFVAITDRTDGLYDDIVTAPFPDLGLPFAQLTSRSCFAKLAMFYPGILQPGLKTIYFDLDTAILGNIERLTDFLKHEDDIYLISSQFIQFWKMRWLLRLIAPKVFYLANSSAVAFLPERQYRLALDFKENITRWRADPSVDDCPPPVALGSDDKFISYFAKDRMKVFPMRVATRFQDKYFTFSAAMSDFANNSRRIKQARKRHVLVTFMGDYGKPEKIIQYRKGDVIKLSGLVCRWDYPEFQDYWTRILHWGRSAE